ncbi:hypothetical protein EJK48_0201 [Moraxella catarrhalis]|uniref:Uncharacterized protein n=1 Tax=Moraxella catarrhalis TaxID=480 RepID=A0A3Q9GCH4_MORCA|nr:hypothetical protein MCR_0189 [Moraxella catarrhalis BBH18]AZQ92385.1 hypothetical protein EJK53_0200 [Moraxella catarrhalis]AZQ95449.1 hypothetical protein EJK48_0201 [Moraxella catarrhalis]RUO14274.1 hypothetical protein EJK49_1401 [Moraxella catarrhalis]
MKRFLFCFLICFLILKYHSENNKHYLNTIFKLAYDNYE